MSKLHFFYVLSLFFLLCSCKKDQIPVDGLNTRININEEKFPNFSHVGYKMGEEPLPIFPVMIELVAQEGDNYSQIQEAINSLAKQPLVNGVRGAVLLKAGLYPVSREIKIRDHGIVLRGEGQDENGTILFSTQTYNFTRIASLQQTAVVSIEGTGNSFTETGAAKSRIKDDVTVGNQKITVLDASGFNRGDTIVVTRTPNDHWIDFIDMRQYGWTARYYEIAHQRVINNVENNELTLNQPMVDAIEEQFGGGWVTRVSYQGKVNNSGVENIRFNSVYEGDEDENHAWSAVKLRRAQNCWVRNITVENFVYEAVGLYQSDFITVQDCAIYNYKSKPIGDRRYSFHLHSNSSNNLFQRCYTNGGRHDYVTGAKISGPNVFLDCIAINALSDTGPHHRWATGTLYDNVQAAKINAKNSKDGGSGHGWTGAYQLIWNSKATLGFIVQSPPGAINWLIGSVGTISTDSDAYIISPGVRVLPRSLYIEQLRARIGQDGLNKIITREQDHDTPVWHLLESWAGKNKPLKGL